MRIFVTGASGMIGFAVASAFARAGHHVRGLVRSPAKTRALAAAEIEPVPGTMEEPQSWASVAQDCQVLVHCAAEHSPRRMDLDRRTIETLVAAARRAALPRKLVYTSGVWIYGDTRGAVVDENSGLHPPHMVAGRIEHEQLVLDASSGALSTLVLRPGCVYGGRGSLTASWFDSAVRNGAARFVGDGRAHWAMVHVDDLADAYLCAAESAYAREVFNVADHSRATVLDCALAASAAAGTVDAIESISVAQAAQKLGGLAECLVLDQRVDSGKAQRMLGWRPRHAGFVEGAARYFAAWRAMQDAPAG
jgi:nucleoside-diphosphate-sugar epimerase